MVLGGCCLKIKDVCMDLEPCFKVHNLAVFQLDTYQTSGLSYGGINS